MSRAASRCSACRPRFENPLPGLVHQPESMPDVIHRKACLMRAESWYSAIRIGSCRPVRQSYLARGKVFELRPVDHELFVHPDPDRPESGLTWARLRTTQPPSGESVMDTAGLSVRHDGIERQSSSPWAQISSTRISPWQALIIPCGCTTSPDFSDWLLMSHEAMGNEAGMGLGRVNIFNRTGTLVASVVQQGFIKSNTD